MKHEAQLSGQAAAITVPPINTGNEQVNPHPFTPGPWIVNEGCENVFIQKSHGGFIAMMQREISPPSNP